MDWLLPISIKFSHVVSGRQIYHLLLDLLIYLGLSDCELGFLIGIDYCQLLVNMLPYLAH